MTIDLDEELDLLLLEHMRQNGFDDNCLGSGPMMTVVKDSVWGSYESAIISCDKNYRSPVFQVSRFIKLGDMLCFPSEMKLKMWPPLTITSALRSFPEKPVNSIIMAIVAVGFTVFSNLKELNKMSCIEGVVSEYKNPPFSKFPFDHWLRIDAIATTWLDLYDQNGMMWRLGTHVLCNYDQLKFRQALPSK